MRQETTFVSKADVTAADLGYACVMSTRHPPEHTAPAQDATAEKPDWSALILRVRDHQDEAAFAKLFNHFAPRIKGFLIKSGTNSIVAEECAQDVMATLWHKARLFDPTRASAATWIFTIARNRRIDMYRQQNRPEPTDLPWGPEPQAEATDTLALAQETAKLSKALEALPEKQRNIIKRAFYGELTHAELAQETGLPLGTIKSRIRLALDRLRRAMS